MARVNDHDCSYKSRVEELEAELARVRTELSEHK